MDMEEVAQDMTTEEPSHRGWIYVPTSGIAVCDCGWDSWGSVNTPEEDGRKHQEETGHPFDEDHVSN